MSIEFIGIAATAPHSETEIAPTQADPVQPGYLEELARAHEEAGFDAVTGAPGNSAALVGSYEQVAQALLRYAGPGVSTLLIRGLIPPDDARDCGTLVRLVHEQADPAALVSAR
jgi:alkanesulfonate monooxygenase SsuD/methylene tetrahydromethanopterin reductase-like flavin-dependent oxidoreductase (luciferase family)